MTKKKATRSKKKGALTYKDVAIQFLVDGVDALNKLRDSGALTDATARRTARYLSTLANSSGVVFEKWLVSKLPALSGHAGRGRPTPQIGETRDYSAQQIKRGTTFIRLPVFPMGAKKKDTISVRYESDRIIVTRKPDAGERSLPAATKGKAA